MPGRTLPSLTPAEIKSHNTAKSCYVTRGSKVYDVTSFIDDHPGGGDLILEHAGTDVSDILADPLSHQHSEAAYEILDECHIGFVSHDPSTPSKTNGDGAVKGPAEAEHVVHENGRPVYASTGMAGEEDLSVETDPNADYQRHKFLDLSKPLFPQLWYGGFSKDFYLDQVHRPRHYRGGASAPLFGNFLEPLSKTPWWVVPLVWLPCVAYASSVGFSGLDTTAERCGYWIFGVAFWTLIEYTLHRCLFHIDKFLPDNRVGVCLHFLLHGIHHYLPMDKYRLVMPPTLFMILAAPFWKFAHFILFHNWYAAVTAYAGGVFGYVCYDMTHYFLHHRNLPSYYRELKKYHLQHHFADYENGFGVTSRFWDRVFGTELVPLKPIKTA